MDYSAWQKAERDANHGKDYPWESHPELWQQEMELYQLEQQTTPMVETSLFQCSRCRGKKCSYIELFLRSGDEASILFITCLTCHKKWKQ